jgi:hypothetical protein
VSDTGTGTVYLRDGDNLIIVSPNEIPKLIAKLTKGIDDFRSNITWEWREDFGDRA